MRALPVFLDIRDRPVLLIGEGAMADAKARLIVRAGGRVVREPASARIAIVAVEGGREANAAVERLHAAGVLVNVVDRPALCDFTIPAIVDRDPVIVAIGTGGASAGLAKALRQRFETLLPARLGALARALEAGRERLRAKWPDANDRRRAIDAALAEGGALDPLADGDAAVEDWLAHPTNVGEHGLVRIDLASADPDDLTLRMARLLGSADRVYFGEGVPSAILDRARADAARIAGDAPDDLPPGLSIELRLSRASPSR